MTWSEDSLHRWLVRRKKAQGLVGSQGHDAAVLTGRNERVVLCTDACVQGVHFEASTAPAQVGAKAAARALSDLAATGARPRALLLALRAPRKASEADLRALIQGVDRMGHRFGAPLVGGDLTAARGPLSLTVSAQGGLPGRGRPVGRDRAKVGQWIVLTGAVGGSILGRHLRWAPRVAEGRALAQAGATAMMDVSDGLALDLDRIARASGVRMRLERVPVHRDAHKRARQTGRDPLEHALTDGEDHELIATLTPARWNQAKARLQRQFPEWTVIGRVVRGSGLDWSPLVAEDPKLAGRMRRLGRLGWQHGD